MGPTPGRGIVVSRGRAGGLAALALASFAAAPGQATQTRPPTAHGDSVVIGADSMYDVRYGRAVLRDLDEDGPPRDWPRRQATRTSGRLFDLQRAGAATTSQAGRSLSWANALSSHSVCGRRHCLAIVPTEEAAYFFTTAARSWSGQQVEIVGAIEDLNKDPRRDPLWAFLVWSVTLLDGRGEGEGPPPEASELEVLVTSPEARAGRRISVKGTFRGANLFDDMPPGSQREAGDWVLKDGPFFIWVTGKRPKGSGFSLDPSSRGDCRWRLEVSGKVEEADGLVYLKAKDVRLLGPAREGPPER